jgi:hypothetical protein
MFVARWQIDARFGHKQTVIELLRKWEREIGSKAGTDKMDMKLLTGSIGVREATVEADHAVESIAQLERFFETIGKSDAHRQWGKDLETLCGVGLRAVDDLSRALRVAGVDTGFRKRPAPAEAGVMLRQ